MARYVTAKPGELAARFGRGERGDDPAIFYAAGGAGASKPDARVLCNAIEEVPVFQGRTLAEELTIRGYDITTLRFSIRKKDTANG